MKRLVIGSIIAAFLLPFSAMAQDKQPTFVMVTKAVHPYYEPCYEGFKAAGAKYKVKVERVDPQKMELPLQVKAIEELIAQRVDGIALSAVDDAGLKPVIAEATKAGIKVITFDAPAPSTAQLTYIGTDNQTAGFEAGKRMAELTKGQGKLVILQGGLGAANLNLRTKGFKEAMAKHAPKVKILEVVDVQGDFSVATNKTEALLQTYPDLTAIFAVSAKALRPRHRISISRSGKILLAGLRNPTPPSRHQGTSPRVLHRAEEPQIAAVDRGACSARMHKLPKVPTPRSVRDQGARLNLHGRD